VLLHPPEHSTAKQYNAGCSVSHESMMHDSHGGNLWGGPGSSRSSGEDGGTEEVLGGRGPGSRGDPGGGGGAGQGRGGRGGGGGGGGEGGGGGPGGTRGY